MISNDVFVLVQFDPPGIELCRVSNMQNEGEEGGLNSHGGQSDELRMDKSCTLLLPPLQQRQDGMGPQYARMIFATVSGVEEYPGYQGGPWPEHPSHHEPLECRRMFCQSTNAYVISIVMLIGGCNWGHRIFEVIVRCANLLAYVDEALAGGGDIEDVPWGAWGPHATTVSDNTDPRWQDFFGERRATVRQEDDSDQIFIRDYNPYRIRQARSSMEGLTGRSCHSGDSRREGEGDADTSHRKDTRRIIESSTISRGEWFQEDITTALPYVETVVDLPGCRAIHMDQNHVLLYMDDLNQVSRVCGCNRLKMRWIAI